MTVILIRLRLVTNPEEHGDEALLQPSNSEECADSSEYSLDSNPNIALLSFRNSF